MYLWGNEIGERDVRGYPALDNVRNALERDRTIQTEPDVVLHVPGKLLVLIKAKLGSPNSTLDKKPYETVQDFLDVYESPDGQDPLDRAWIARQSTSEILGQLCRLIVFGTRMAEHGANVVLVNLLRQQDMHDSFPNFAPHLSASGPVKFGVGAWEHMIPLADHAGNDTLHQYLTDKSYCLRPPFDL